MKELTIEEKAQRYDEALDRANAAHKDEDRHLKATLERIFPELKESEDEKIRKAIHIYLDWLDGRKDYAPKGEYTIKDMIDWLEKQGEHANFCNKIQIGDKVTRNEDGVLVNLSQLNRVAKKQGKQETLCDKCRKEQPSHSCQDITALGRCAVEHEQKPAEFDDANAKRMFIKALERVEEQNNKGYKLTDCDKNSWWEDFKTYCGYIEIQKPAWSEEDKKMTRFIGNAITTDEASTYLKDKGIEVIDAHVWLDSFKDRVQPKLKQEWSEEDELIVAKILCICNDFERSFECSPSSTKVIKEDVDKIDNWLKSLRPQKKWKPSEGQLECLGYAIEKAEKDWSPLTNNRIYLTLKALKEQLLELRGSKV